MKEFKNLADFTAHLEKLVPKLIPLKLEALEITGQVIEDAAKRKFGTYQEGVGHYDEWEELKAATQAQRVRLGFSPNDPLYRTGELMHSIAHRVDGETVTIGSDSDIMIYQEMGTENIPPRPVLAPAMFEERKYIKETIDELLLSWITDKKMAIKKY